MTKRYLKWLLAVAVASVLLLGLVLWWPLKMWTPWLNQQLPPGWRIHGVTGSLWSGTASQLMILGTRIGPWQWQLDPWHQRLNWQLGTTQASPWVGHLDWQGGDRWRLIFSNGDMRWIDTRAWGVQLVGIAEGQMDVSGMGVQCRKVTQGQAAWTPLKIVWPGQHKELFPRIDVALGCLEHGRWSLDAMVQEDDTLKMSVSGRQLELKTWQWSLNGWVSAQSHDHPLIEPLRAWLSPDAQGHFHKRFRTAGR